ncbi:DUF1993 domain-containing protein [Ruegeria sp. 2205SS24-7]|uniref:DUF1993 domain-containing protein n=1 Tax=Ruegeria discodermiae TaxID=3064389 RepID=UPI0027411E16|nr:DUF1993 domain-containing protein [Ruegeria sp. 2205SS24-7]MDP5219046.1 DUF1993 domain-containing protein [Ruegeria sp. 2205SS24-7]
MHPTELALPRRSDSALRLRPSGPFRNRNQDISTQSPIPSFSHSLKSLSAILTTAEQQCADRDIDPNAMLGAWLFPDMANFTRNVQMACDAAKIPSARLSQTENPVHEDTETTFAELRGRIDRALDFVAAIPENAFEGAETREIVPPLLSTIEVI